MMIMMRVVDVIVVVVEVVVMKRMVRIGLLYHSPMGGE